MNKRKLVDISALKFAGLKVGRLRPSPSLTEEALSLATVLQTWNLADQVHIRHYDAAHARFLHPDGPVTPVYVIELIGQRISVDAQPAPHMLAYVPFLGVFRLLALVEPNSQEIIAALVQPEDGPFVLLRPKKESVAAI